MHGCIGVATFRDFKDRPHFEVWGANETSGPDGPLVLRAKRKRIGLRLDVAFLLPDGEMSWSGLLLNKFARLMKAADAQVR